MVGGVLTVPEALAGFSEPRLVVGLMLAASGVGAFMSSTAVVANFVPVVLSVANKARLNLKRLLMALSVGVPISGMMTLIATAPSLAVQKALKDRGLENSGFFSFSSFRVAVLLLAIVFILLAACVNWRKSLIIN